MTMLTADLLTHVLWRLESQAAALVSMDEPVPAWLTEDIEWYRAQIAGP